MKSIAALLFLTAFSFLVEAKNEGFRPLNIVVPADQHKTQEWRHNMAAQVPDPRITSGRPARRGQFPWQVAIMTDTMLFCGGSLISETWILTAASCAYNATSFSLVLGAIHLTVPDNGAVVKTSNYSILHNGYNNVTLANDIALIKLPEPVNFTSYISPVRLPSRSQVNNSFENKAVQMSGWGLVSDNSLILSDILQYANMTVITNNKCKETFNGITDKNLCVSTADSGSPCFGDGGGALVFREDNGTYTEVGILIFVHREGCEKGHPVGFTRLTSYLDWIEENTSNSWKPQGLSGLVMGLLCLIYLLCFQ